MKQQLILWTLFCGALLATAAPLSAGDAWKAAEMDWPHWRGPEMNGVSRETGLIESWSPRGENVIWKNDELATRSNPIVMRGKIYALARSEPETEREAERVICADAATGELLWENKFNAFLTDVPDTRVAWSSVVGDPDTGNVFALGVAGYFQCLDGETGETIWAHSLFEEYGLLSTYGGRTNIPVVSGDLVIISSVIIGWGDMAKPAHRFIAFDKRNGQAVWFTSTKLFPDDTTYSTPITAVIDGQSLMIVGGSDGAVHAFQPQTGNKVWSYYATERGINVTPLLVGNTVICGQAEENLGSNTMGSLFAIDATQKGDITKTGELWNVKEWMVGRSTPLHVDGRIYAVEDHGNMLVVDLATGKLITSVKLGGPSRGSPVYADGKIYVCSENGRFWIFRPTDDGVEKVFQARLSREEVLGSPVISHGRIYLPTTETMYCLGLADRQPAAEPRPAPPEQAPVSEDQTPTHLQVVPVESLLRPGTQQKFDARVYNSRGQFLRMARNVQFSVAGAGSISAEGTFSTPPDMRDHAAAFVTANAEGLTGSARIRIVPDLPWSFDFASGEVPITWVGCRYRHITLDFDFLKSLEAANPIAAQLYIYLSTEFINNGQPAVTYDNSTPRQLWTEFLRFQGLHEDKAVLKTVAGAKAALEPALQLLIDERFLKSAEFSEWTGPGGEVAVRLKVERGPRGIEGNAVMTKITTIPKGARSQGSLGHPDLHDYTVVADVLAATKDGKLPDIGITAQRYVLDLQGALQTLQIRTWHSQARMAQSVPFEWKADVWYTMKLRASVEDGKAVLRGKVWPRDEPEPESWSVEASDESPNLTGSPGLYGNAKDAEIFYDKIQVIHNDAEAVAASGSLSK